MSNIHERMFDKRVVERNIKRGKVTQAQYDAWLASLEDCTELSEDTETVFITRVPDEDEG
ncbi:MAG: hypothetical protein ACI8RZ_001573 [Myxococcota bacterium]|jgi:hypothetical protein